MPVHCVCARVVEVRRGIGFLGTGVTEACELPHGAENQTWVLFMSKLPPNPTPARILLFFIFKYLVWEPKFHLYRVELGGVLIINSAS